MQFRALSLLLIVLTWFKAQQVFSDSFPRIVLPSQKCDPGNNGTLLLLIPFSNCTFPLFLDRTGCPEKSPKPAFLLNYLLFLAQGIPDLLSHPPRLQPALSTSHHLPAPQGLTHAFCLPPSPGLPLMRHCLTSNPGTQLIREGLCSTSFLTHLESSFISPKSWLCWFPKAAVSNYHKPSGLEQLTCALLQFWRPEGPSQLTELKPGGLDSPGSAREGTHSLVPPPSRAAFLALLAQGPSLYLQNNLCSIFRSTPASVATWCSSVVRSPFPSLLKGPLGQHWGPTQITQDNLPSPRSSTHSQGRCHHVTYARWHSLLPGVRS